MTFDKNFSLTSQPTNSKYSIIKRQIQPSGKFGNRD